MRWRLASFQNGSHWLGKPLVAALCLLFFLLYWRQDSAYRESFEKLQFKLKSCRENSESLVVKLQVLNEHKLRLEAMFNETKEALEILREESTEARRKCQLELLAAKDKLKSCATTQPPVPVAAAPQIPPAYDLSEVPKLQEKLQIAEAAIERHVSESKTAAEELQKITGLLDECRRREDTRNGLPPRADYMRNGSAHFARQHKQGEALSFNREAIKEAPLRQILPPKELMEKLRQREEERNQHPDDRAPDENVNELPDTNEKDYKEH